MSEAPFMRMAAPTDLEELRSMLLEDDPEDYIPDVLDRWIEDRSTYVATDGREILGMAHKQIVPDGSLWLGGLRVRGSARRKGVGKLIAEFMVTLPDSNTYRLVVDQENEASIALTLKTGYVERLAVSLWVSVNEEHDMEFTDVDSRALRLRPGDYFGTGGLLPTAWYAFELNERAVRVIDDYGLKFVSDRQRNIFLMSLEHGSLTPLVLRKRDALSRVPGGYVVFGTATEELADLGFEQSLWAKRLVFFEFARNAVTH